MQPFTGEVVEVGHPEKALLEKAPEFGVSQARELAVGCRVVIRALHLARSDDELPR